MIKVKQGDFIHQIEEKDLEKFLACGYSLLIDVVPSKISFDTVTNPNIKKKGKKNG